MKKINSLQHPLVKHLVKIRCNSTYRNKHHSLLLEGIKPINEVCNQSNTLHLLTENLEWVPKGLDSSQVTLVSREIIKKISAMENPEGIVSEVKAPAFQNLDRKKFILALDGIADPGNMGSLLRTALALGWDGAFITETSVDPFNDKAVRASRGAIFRLPLMIGSTKDLECLAKKNDLKLIVADVQGESLDSLTPLNGCVLVLGNEASGSSLSNHCTRITIPMLGEMESLNVAIAGGILMHHLRH